VGALIGGGLGFLPGLFGNDDPPPDLAAEMEKRRLAIYQQLMGDYTTDPRIDQGLNQLQGLSTQQGLTDQERSMLAEGLATSNDQARGQMGAIQQRAQAQGGGQGMGGLGALLQQNAAQAAAGRTAQVGVGAAAMTDQRRQQALQAYTEGAMRNAQNQNQYRLGASGQAAVAAHGEAALGAKQWEQQQAQSESNVKGWQQAINNVGGAVAYGAQPKAPAPQATTPKAPQGDFSGWEAPPPSPKKSDYSTLQEDPNYRLMRDRAGVPVPNPYPWEK
jgi:hypothetical protein